MFTREPDGSPSFFTIVLAVFVGALLAMLAHDGIVELRLRYEIAQVEKAVQRDLQKTKAAAEQRRAESQRQQDALDETMLANQSARALAQRLQRERDERRAVAWAKFFQPSPACKLDSSTAICANQHLAARKRFDAEYVDR